jgi:glycosyltransferase involved in cell wall biosynthesis
VSVVVPVWGARYVASLARAVASVRAQDPPAPVIVVDNASDVEVPEIAGTTVVRSPGRLTVGRARNLGLEHVATDYVVVLDADDELAEGALARLRDGIEASPDIAVYAMSLLEADSGARHRSPRRFVPALTRAPRLLALATAVWSLYPIQGNATMRTGWIREAGGYPDSDDGEDWVLAVSQAFRGRVVIDPRPGRIYHADAQSARRAARRSSRLLLAARQVRTRLRADPAVPRWTRAAIPLIAVLQTLFILVARPLYRVLRAPFAAARTAAGGGRRRDVLDT